MDGFVVLSSRCVVHGKEIIELSDSWVVLSLPEGIINLYQLVYPISLLCQLLLDAPLDRQQTALGAVVVLRFKEDEVVDADVLELLVL